MNAPLSKVERAAAILAECRLAHQDAINAFNAAQARGYGLTDLGLGKAVSDTAKALFLAANMDFLERDLENDRKAKREA